MMIAVDLSSLGGIRAQAQGAGDAPWWVNWLIKPFNHGGAGRAVLRAGSSPGADRPRRNAPPIHRRVDPAWGQRPCTAMVFVWSQLTREGDPETNTGAGVAERHHHGLRLRAPSWALLLGPTLTSRCRGKHCCCRSRFYVVIPLLAGAGRRGAALMRQGGQGAVPMPSHRADQARLGGRPAGHGSGCVFGFQGPVIRVAAGPDACSWRRRSYNPVLRDLPPSPTLGPWAWGRAATPCGGRRPAPPDSERPNFFELARSPSAIGLFGFKTPAQAAGGRSFGCAGRGAGDAEPRSPSPTPHPDARISGVGVKHLWRK